MSSTYSNGKRKRNLTLAIIHLLRQAAAASHTYTDDTGEKYTDRPTNHSLHMLNSTLIKAKNIFKNLKAHKRSNQ